uniref:Uncharacterized protein n=1 Tax=Kangiella spongicola TaxID=796379 RepID=A0A318D375_9GAMM
MDRIPGKILWAFLTHLPGKITLLKILFFKKKAADAGNLKQNQTMLETPSRSGMRKGDAAFG